MNILKTISVCLVASLALACADENEPTKGYEISQLNSSTLLEPREICVIFADAEFGGSYNVSKIITEMKPDPLSDDEPLPFSTVTFELTSNPQNPPDAPSDFEVETRGGDFPEGGSLSADFEVSVKTDVVLFPTRGKDGFKLRNDGIFETSQSRTVSNEYHFKTSAPSIDMFLADYVSVSSGESCDY